MQELSIIKKTKPRWPKGWIDQTKVMGVINLTPDSFSDGGDFNDIKTATTRASQLIDEGVDVIDLGPQSTRPGSNEVGAEEELRRLLPSLRQIRANHPDVIISVDTFLSSVADAAISNGADWINDVSGGRRDPEMLKVVSDLNCPYVITHSRGNSKTMDSLAKYNDLVSEILEELLSRVAGALNHGVRPESIILDPGLGFAKTINQNICILNNLEKITSLGYPVLIGPSRKRFIGETLNVHNMEDRIWGTNAVLCKCVSRKIALVRVHDVFSAVKTIKMAQALWS